jgi:hypothetical protein
MIQLLPYIAILVCISLSSGADIWNHNDNNKDVFGLNDHSRDPTAHYQVPLSSPPCITLSQVIGIATNAGNNIRKSGYASCS